MLVTIAFVAMILLLMLAFDFCLGQLIKIELNRRTGIIEGIHQRSPRIADYHAFEFVAHDLYIFSWIFLPLGFGFILGWKAAGMRGYNQGLREGEEYRELESARQGHIDLVVSNLINNSYRGNNLPPV